MLGAKFRSGSTRLVVLLEPEEKSAAEEAARIDGRSASGFVRRLILAELQRSEAAGTPLSV